MLQGARISGRFDRRYHVIPRSAASSFNCCFCSQERLALRVVDEFLALRPRARSRFDASEVNQQPRNGLRMTFPQIAFLIR